MDAKALAKSKRAHSLHHKKKHPTHQGLKAPPAGLNDKKAAGKQVKEQPLQSHDQQTKEKTPPDRGSRALPSNWDRYDEEFDLASEEAQSSSSQPTDSVVPKSKGADYGYLISEAKAQSQLQYSSDAPFFDDFNSDFTQDFGPMLAAKGQSILSWIIDDSFEFESKSSTNIEAPFLSINLNALAKQLAKAKLSERLYLEPDVLPQELIMQLDEARDEDRHDHQTNTSAAETNTTASSLGFNLGAAKNIEQQCEPESSSISTPGDFLVQTSEDESVPVKKNSSEILLSQEIKRNYSPVSEKPPIFEAASAEAELDMLLNSFSETTILESSGSSVMGLPSTSKGSGVSMKIGTRVMEPVLNPANIDDAVDDLLKETSVVDEEIPFVTKGNSESMSSGTNPVSKSKILDDFDSWLDTI